MLHTTCDYLMESLGRGRKILGERGVGDILGVEE
jgi:hypothetical protein